jgi:hypothetical protein
MAKAHALSSIVAFAGFWLGKNLVWWKLGFYWGFLQKEGAKRGVFMVKTWWNAW